MNVRQIAIVGGAILVGGAAFLWMRGQAAPASQPAAATAVAAPAPSSVQVLVAKRDLLVGERITVDAIGWADWPATGASASFYTQERNATAIEDLTDGVVRQAMVTGEPLTTTKVVVPGTAGNTLAALLTPGMRATSIAITPDAAVAGFVLPNDRVDVVLTREMQISEGGSTVPRVVTSTVLENVRVLAIDQNLNQNNQQSSLTGATATLELTLPDAEKLRMADRLGDLSLTLRSYADNAGPTLARMDSAAMVQPRPVPAAAAATTPPANGNPPSTPVTNSGPPGQGAPSQVKIYRGGQ